MPCRWPSGLNGGMPARLQHRIVLPAALAWLGWFALGQTAEPVDLARAEALARQYCITCHLFPEPDLLDKKTWTSQVMPRMAIRMGLSPESVNQHPEADALWKSGRFLREPLITKADYFAIVEYYKAKAPEEAVAQKPVAPIGLDFRQFTARPSRFRRSVGAVNMVRIDEARRRIYHSDGINKFLDVLDSAGNWVESLQVGNVPVGFAENGGDFFLTMIGTFTPSDIPRGELALLRHENAAFVLKKTVLPKIPRPTHTNFADLNGDGRTDLIVSMYGNNIGRLSWFEKKENGDYAENILLPRSGTLSTAVHDFNGDGHPDIAALVAQEVEAMYLFLNDGKGVFTQHMVFQGHPLYGHSSFELTDFNGDGRPDFVVTNGDNGEYPSPPKSYHGIRVYLNRGGMKYEKSLFLPLNGAFRALARDYDADGDTDIAAVSYFPNYNKSPRESFVYFENKDGKYTANTFRTCISGRWLTMDAGDVDGDGDIDLALGNYTYGPDKAIFVPDFLMKTWERSGPPVMILYNNLHSKPAKR
ncbi:VCBS repeat-containing protein [Verrucomicrobia bacterium]|nr:VCBS repeat-containing protein [Verrucomicrobiota bacterium]